MGKGVRTEQRKRIGLEMMITVQLAARTLRCIYPVVRAEHFSRSQEDGSGKDGGRVIGKLTLAYCLVI